MTRTPAVMIVITITMVIAVETTAALAIAPVVPVVCDEEQPP